MPKRPKKHETRVAHVASPKRRKSKRRRKRHQFQAKCSCGWQSDKRRTRNSPAKREAKEHKDSAVQAEEAATRIHRGEKA